MMTNNLPANKRANIFELVYARADAYGYATRTRPDNRRFLNSLVIDPDIGGVLQEFMPQEDIRTYIKDTILNRYTKDLVKRKIGTLEPTAVFQMVFGEDTLFVGEKKTVSICRGSNNELYVLSTGTYLKWETALRKAMECVATSEKLSNAQVHICLGLVVINDDITIGDKKALEDELAIVNAKVFFIG